MEWRLYERATKGGGAVIKSTGAGGAVVTSSSAGGGVSKSTSAGGGSTQTSSNMTGFSQLGFETGEDLNRGSRHVHTVILSGDNFEHRHTLTIPPHQHGFQVPDHQHSVVIQDHQHSINIPEHKHDLEYGIFEYNKMPTRHTIKVDGNTLPITSLSGEDIDLIPYLTKDSEGKVTRDWHTLEIIPNDLARVTASIATQFFVQSRGGGNY